jgi:hypothetical protein
MSDPVSNEVLAKLKFIGQIRRGEKVFTKDLSIMQDSFYTSFMRTFFSIETREDTYTFLNEIIKNAFDLLMDYSKKDDKYSKVMIQHILEDMDACRTGLFNIKSTYHNDVMFTCKVDTLLQQIEANLAQYNYTYKNLQCSSDSS